MAAHFDGSRPNISKHLRVLREAGLAEERRVGTRRLYRARPERLAEARAFLESFWDQNLAVIKASAEAEAKKGRLVLRGRRDGVSGPDRLDHRGRVGRAVLLAVDRAGAARSVPLRAAAGRRTGAIASARRAVDAYQQMQGHDALDTLTALLTWLTLARADSSVHDTTPRSPVGRRGAAVVAYCCLIRSANARQALAPNWSTGPCSSCLVSRTSTAPGAEPASTQSPPLLPL